MGARGTATRVRILEATRELLAERGAAAWVRVDDVAARAGTTKATLYRHFSSKRALMAAVAPEFVDPIEAGSRRDGILDAASAVVARHGVHGMTMGRIAAEAGVSPAALYLYVRGKNDLLVAVAERLASRIVPLLVALGAEEDVATALLGFAPRAVEVQAQYIQTFSVLMGEVATRPELAAALYERVVAPITHTFGGHLEREVERGAFRPGHRLVRVLAFVGMLTFYNLARRAFGARLDIPPPEAAAREIAQIFLRGVMATPESAATGRRSPDQGERDGSP